MKLEFIIKSLIQNNKIKTQSELEQILKKKGFNTTQSNISRILKKINTVKLIDENKDTYYIVRSRPLELAMWIRNLVVNIDTNGYDVVVKTYQGAAGLIKQIIEERNIDNVLAVISSDNVIIVVPVNVKFADVICSKLKTLLMMEDKSE